MRALVLLTVCWFLSACSNGSGQTCAQLHSTCGIDDFGNTCGTCPGGTACMGGLCGSTQSPTCGVQAFSECNSTNGTTCCSDPISNVPTLCTLIVDGLGRSYCLPLCQGDSDCIGFNSSTVQYACIRRTDGISICAPSR